MELQDFSVFAAALRSDGVQGDLFKTMFISLAASFGLLALWYFFKLQFIPEFMPKYGLFLFLTVLSYAMILPSIVHVRAYKEFSCMSGMMIGMTIGMIAGLLPSFYVGATNGMFLGSMFGMTTGIFFGIWNGKCCGIMGVLEGIMAGFMGGLMGAMTSLMLFNDHLKIASVVLFAVSAVIMVGLNFMIYKETREVERRHKDHGGFVMVWSIILTGITTWLMLFGPRSLLLQ